ncbi:MAG: protein kinase, partial [Chloroflexota bacterium]
MTLKSGELIRNRYRIMHQLSDSAYRAMDMSLRQPCLVKEFSGTTSERVTQLAHVQHPNLPRVIDLVRQGEQSLLVMDFIDGTSLSEKLFQFEDGVPAADAQKWLEELVDTLSYLHEQEPPIAHGDVSIDHIIIRPDGSAALTDYSIYERNHSEDLVNLGLALGYLVTGSLPPVPHDEMIAKLDGRSEPNAQRALGMLNGTISSITTVLDPLEPGIPDKSEASTVGLEEMMAADENSSTVLLESPFLSDSDDSQSDADAAPVMPWDKQADDQQSPKTEVWGQRVEELEEQEEERSAQTSQPFEHKTELLTPLTTELGAPQPDAPEVISQSITNDPPVTSTPEETVSSAEDMPEESESSGFNWLWIIVGVMAGVLLLCSACIGFIYWNWSEITADLTPVSGISNSDSDLSATEVSIADLVAEDDTKEPTATLLPSTATPLPVDEDEAETSETEDEEPQFNLPEPEEDTENAEESDPASDEPEAASEAAGEYFINETFGYALELPPGLMVTEEVDGTLTAESADGSKGLFMAVFPNEDGITTDFIMEQAMDSAVSEGGIILSDPTTQTFNDLEGPFVLVEIPDEESGSENLLGVIYTVA